MGLYKCMMSLIHRYNIVQSILTVLGILCGDFPDCPGVKNLSANAEDTGSIPGLGRFHMSWYN